MFSSLVECRNISLFCLVFSLNLMTWIVQTTMKGNKCYLENTRVKVVNVNHSRPDYGVGLEQEGRACYLQLPPMGFQLNLLCGS